jgi:molecular chaperone HtpG
MTADAVLRPFKCTAEIRKFDPAELPALYSINSEGRFLRSVEQTKEVADSLWAGVLDGLAKRESATAPPAHLCFNYQNRLLRRLIDVKNGEPLRRAIQMLYVQSLLLGHHALSAREMALLNEGLLGLIDASLSAS